MAWVVPVAMVAPMPTTSPIIPVCHSFIRASPCRGGWIRPRCARFRRSEQYPFGLAGIVDQAEVRVVGRAGIDAVLVVEHVVDVDDDLLRLRPGRQAVQIVARIADADRELLGRNRAERGGPAGLGDDNLLPGILRLDLVVG